MRLFVAIEISDVLRNSVELRIESTRARLPAASWLRPDALHLTLAFLGEQSDESVETIAICRIRSRWRQEDAEAFTQTFSDIDTPPFEVHEVVLFRSELRQEGAVHTPLHRVSLVRRA